MLGTYTVDDQIGAQPRLSIKALLAWSFLDLIAGFDLQLQKTQRHRTERSHDSYIGPRLEAAASPGLTTKRAGKGTAAGSCRARVLNADNVGGAHTGATVSRCCLDKHESHEGDKKDREEFASHFGLFGVCRRERLCFAFAGCCGLWS